MAQRFVSTGSFFRDGRTFARQLTAGANGTVLQCNSTTPTGFEFAPVIFPPAENLATTLIAGNSAGSNTINMNSNKITSCAEPTQPQDVATKNYVDTKPSNELFYTNPSNAIVSVPLPTASNEKLNLIASGLNPGVWSNISLATDGLITAYLVSVTGLWVATLGTGSGAKLYYFNNTTGALVSSLTVRCDVTPKTPRINCLYQYNKDLPSNDYYLFFGGDFDTLVGTGPNVTAYNVGRLDLGSIQVPFTPKNLVSFVPPSGYYYGVNGTVNTLITSVFAGGVDVLILGGDFNNTAPQNYIFPVKNLMEITYCTISTGVSSFNNEGGNFSTGLGVVNKIINNPANSPLGTSDFYIGGTFEKVGSALLDRPYFVNMTLDPTPFSIGGVLIPNLNGPILDMVWTSRDGVFGFHLLLTGNFNLSAYNGSNQTCYYNKITSQIYPAFDAPTGMTAGKVGSYGGTFAPDFITFYVNGTNSSSSFISPFGSTNLATTTVYWTSIGSNGSNSGVPLGLQLSADGQSLISGSTPSLLLERYTLPTAPPVATFRLPTASFYPSTGQPPFLYKTVTFPTGVGSQTFISVVSLSGKLWVPIGEWRGLTFS